MTIIILIIGTILVILSSIGKAVRDTLAHHLEQSIFKDKNPIKWNPVLSGSNKWKGGDRNNGEKFPLSSTLLVSFTEVWHKSETVNVFGLIAGTGLLALSIGLWGIVLSRVIYGLCFTLYYRAFRINN